jgi:hypothetical protein
MGSEMIFDNVHLEKLNFVNKPDQAFSIRKGGINVDFFDANLIMFHILETLTILSCNLLSLYNDCWL